jgi:hypothetical protein
VVKVAASLCEDEEDGTGRLQVARISRTLISSLGVTLSRMFQDPSPGLVGSARHMHPSSLARARLLYSGSSRVVESIQYSSKLNAA